MARPIEFDHDDVITRATDQFWKDGYVASSVQKLLDATGINRGTMYNSFGEKEAFFRSCVEHYNELLAEQIDNTLANKALKPAQAIDAFFLQIVSGHNQARRSYGCLLVNSLCESIVWEEPLARLIRDSINVVRKALLVRTRELEKAKALAPRVTADFAADQLLSLYQSCKLGGRAGKSSRHLLEQVQFSLAAILK